jgi:hypothetical protein
MIVKSRILYFIFSFILLNNTNAQEDSAILSIRNEFNKINSNMKICKKKIFSYSDAKSNPGKIDFEAYYMPHGRLVKIIALIKNGKVDKHFEYYCKGNAVFFMFLKEKKPDETLSEERIYIDDNHHVVKALIKEKHAGDMRDFSKIKSENSNNYWPDLKELAGHAFYGDEIVEKYFTYLVFEVCDDFDLKIKRIKDEYNRIESARKSGILNEQNISYTNETAYWNNTNYTVFFDEKMDMVLLKYGVGEEGYYSENQIYFKDRKPFFVFSSETEPDDTQYQKRFYIYNDKMVNALVKKLAPDEARDFSEVENKIDSEMMNDPQSSSIVLIKGIENEIARMHDGFENRE